MATLDLSYLALVVVALVIDHFMLWPRFVRCAPADPRQARLALWKAWMSMLWLLALAALALWLHEARPWVALGLHFPGGWRLWAAAGMVLAVVALYAPTITRLGKISEERKQALRVRFGDHAALLPHTRTELAWFIALSLTAGFCEELIFRGYLPWALQTVVDRWAAAGISCVVFALAHAYQGREGVIKTGVVGAFLMAAVLAFGSIIPAIVVHALIDVGQGLVAWLVLREDHVPGEPGGADRGPVEQASQHA